MCDPVVGMTLIGVGTLATGAMQYAGMKQQQSATRKEMELNQRRTNIEIENVRRRADRLRSSQRVAFTKGGVALAGSPLEVMAQSAADAERDIANLREGGALVNEITASRGRSSSIASMANIGSTLISGSSTILSGINQQRQLEQYGGGINTGAGNGGR